jgi:predicted phosphodiesterase
MAKSQWLKCMLVSWVSGSSDTEIPKLKNCHQIDNFHIYPKLKKFRTGCFTGNLPRSKQLLGSSIKTMSKPLYTSNVPGYICAGHVSLAQFLPKGKRFKPALCFSDTHIHSTESHFSNDIPAEILFILQQHPKHCVYWLGDVLESAHLKQVEAEKLIQRTEFKAIIDDLCAREFVKIIPGNHDRNVHKAMINLFGQNRISINGFKLGAVIFTHGHEPLVDIFSAEIPSPTLVTPLLGALQRVGLLEHEDKQGNKLIAEYYNRKNLYPVFGHTHFAEVTNRYANSGCILRYSQSYITIEGERLFLWKTLK